MIIPTSPALQGEGRHGVVCQTPRKHLLATVEAGREQEAAVMKPLQPQLELETYGWSVTDSCCWGAGIIGGRG